MAKRSKEKSENITQEKLNVLVFGSGAREHAIADSISKSPLLNKLYLVNANEGFVKLGESIDYNNFEDLAKRCVDKYIDMAIIGPEEPLCEGIADVFKDHNIFCIGVDKYFSQLESSKLFAKKFMEKYNIKTAKYTVVNADTMVKTLPMDVFPLVIKANGLCKGKGVKIVYDSNTAMTTIVEYLNGKFGESSKTIILEEYLGEDELSLMSLWDGKNLLNFMPSKDFKKLSNSPDAPNTGGMGAFCPVKLTEDQQKKLELYQKQLENALKSENAYFAGFIYSGLIWAEDKEKPGTWDWFVLEYNIRLGDPEIQAILTSLQTDFLEVLAAAKSATLNKVKLKYKKGYSGCLVIACEGYPAKPRDGYKMFLPLVEEGINIYFAGIKDFKGKLFSKGGRVLSICTNSENPFPTLKDFAQKIELRHKYYRDDIDIK